MEITSDNKRIIGFTCGSFDLCHAGHILMFQECKNYCDYLIVGMQINPNIDQPGKNIPIMSATERFIILNGIKWIDVCYVILVRFQLLNACDKFNVQI